MEALTKTEAILTNIKQMLRLTNTDHDIWLDSLISQCSRDINSNETLVIKNCEVKVENNKFYLPEDCKEIIAFRDKRSCLPGVFIDIPFFKRCGCNVNRNFNSLVSLLNINGRWANFINACPDTEAEIAYKIVNTVDGQVVINEEAYTAISNYVAYQFALAYPENYIPEQRRDWRQDGVWGRARVRSAAAKRKADQDRVQIQRIMGQMINTNIPFYLLWGNNMNFTFTNPTI